MTVLSIPTAAADNGILNGAQARKLKSLERSVGLEVHFVLRGDCGWAWYTPDSGTVVGFESKAAAVESAWAHAESLTQQLSGMAEDCWKALSLDDQLDFIGAAQLAYGEAPGP